MKNKFFMSKIKLLVLAIIILLSSAAFAAEMKVWSYRPGELIASFPDYPYPTDWVNVVNEAFKKANDMGYIVTYHNPIEYYALDGLNLTSKTFTSAIKIRFISMGVRPKKPTDVQVMPKLVMPPNP